MKVDYIIVGLGIAGVTFSKQLMDHNKSFVVIADRVPGATLKSGGIFNPVVLRRFTAPVDTPTFIDYANEFYSELQHLTNTNWRYSEQKVSRIFASIEEQNNWFAAADKRHLKPFLTPKLVANQNPHVNADFGFGEVSNSFRIDAFSFIQSFETFLKTRNNLLSEPFDYSALALNRNTYSWKYKHVEAKKIVFAEGVGITKNPFVSSPVIYPNKGEFLIIKSPELKANKILKGAVYIIPLGNDIYKVGATYSPNDLSSNSTIQAKIEIEGKLKKMISCNYEVIDQVVGVRPVTKDRQPVLGQIKENMYVFNGLGTRGFTRGPLYSKYLYDFIENKISLPSEKDISRFIS